MRLILFTCEAHADMSLRSARASDVNASYMHLMVLYTYERK
jgi:hypothetical protein